MESVGCQSFLSYRVATLAFAWLLLNVTVAHAEDFDKDDWAPATAWEVHGDLDQTLFADIEKALGAEERQALESRVPPIEASMQPIFQALVKNEYSKLGHPSSRYLLHRFFVEQHGWYIDGLFTEGAALNSSSPTNALKDRVPQFVQGLFEKRLGGRGFGLHELAALAAVVEDSVNKEAMKQLKMTYQVLGMDEDVQLTPPQLQHLVEMHMTSVILAVNMSTATRFSMKADWQDMPVLYPTWPRAKIFFNGIVKKNTETMEFAGFPKVAAVVGEIMSTFGKFHGRQCSGLKENMMALEKNASAGCVKLNDFYAKGLKADANWLFIESPDYLRHIGVLDETNPQDPQLLTANYINSPTNCLQPAGFFLVCCHNECDDIMGSLEKAIGKPSATTSEILGALPGSLAKNLRGRPLHRRLAEVAAYHGGEIPIHGRLFAQWLHHAYPHECPYPHMSGTKKPEWISKFEAAGGVSQMSDEEMVGFIRNSSQAHHRSSPLPPDAGSCAPWKYEEELFAPLVHPAMSLAELEQDPHVWFVTAGCASLAAVVSMLLQMMKTFRSLSGKHQAKMLQI